MLRKLFWLMLLFLFTLTLIGGALIQTDKAKQILASWLEQKTEGALKIEKIEGTLPFWIKVKNLHYTEEGTDVQIDKMRLLISPFHLLLGQVSVLFADLGCVEVKSEASNGKWPHFPLPITLYSFSIKELRYNDFTTLALAGRAELQNNFSVQVTLTSPKLGAGLIDLSLQADDATKTLALTAHLQQNHTYQFWVSGQYAFQEQTFVGKMVGSGPDMHMASELTLDPKSDLNLQNLKLTFNHHVVEGEVSYTFDQQKLTAKGDYLSLPFLLEAQFDLSPATSKTTRFTLDYAQNRLEGNLGLNFENQKLDGELVFQIEDLSQLPIEGELQGKVTANVKVAGDQIALTLQGEKVEWKGLLFPQIKLEGTWANDHLSYHVTLEELTVRDPAFEVFPSLYFELQGELSKTALSSSGKVWQAANVPFTFSCHLPLQVSGWSVEIDETAPFSFAVQGKGNIDPLLAFLENASLVARGDLDIAIQASGTWQEPSLSGHLIYQNGRIESLATGALFRDILMEMEASGRELTIRSLIAHDFDRGDLSATGSLTWSPKEHFPFDFQLYANRYTLFALDPLTATVKGQIACKGNMRGIDVSGKATIQKAHLSIPSKMPVNVPTVEVCYVNQIENPLFSSPANPKNLIPLHLDIEIDSPGNLTLEGMGLISEWRGNVHIQGEQNDLHYSGTLKLVQGRFNLLNRKFDLVEGKVWIEGLQPKQLFVDVKGDYELAAMTLSIRVSGPLNQAQVSFSSTPPMSTNQILSWIMFNQDINELSPFQAARLASLLVSLSSSYSGPSTWSAIKDGLGIDVFNITDCDLDSADLTFQVGKYISQGTYVGINKSISGNFDSVLIQTRLYRDFFLEANYGGSLNGLTPNGGKAILKWYKTY